MLKVTDDLWKCVIETANTISNSCCEWKYVFILLKKNKPIHVIQNAFLILSITPE